MKEKIYVGKTVNSNDTESLFTINTTWQIEKLKTVEKLFKHYVLDDIHPSKRPILKNYSVLLTEIENKVLQSWNVSVSQGIAMHSQSQRFFVDSIFQFKTWKLFTKAFHFCVTLVIHIHLGSCFQ